jgi:hypothetical protein
VFVGYVTLFVMLDTVLAGLFAESRVAIFL